MINYGHEHRKRGGRSTKKELTRLAVGDDEARKLIKSALNQESKGKFLLAIENLNGAIQSAHDSKLIQFAENRKRLCENKIRNNWS